MDWLRNVILFSTAIGFVQWLAPGGTFDKYIKYIAALLTLAVILSPLMKPADVAASASAPVWNQGSVNGSTRNFNGDNSGGISKNYTEASAQIRAAQSYQIIEIIRRRIADTAEKRLQSDFPDITVDSIEVYIEQESLEKESAASCLVSVRVKGAEEASAKPVKADRSTSGVVREEIRRAISSELNLDRSQVLVRWTDAD